MSIHNYIKRISIFGNPDLTSDSLPIKILPRLQKEFPHIQFIVEDPQECLERTEDDWWIIDTVRGIDEVELIEDISKFEQTHSVSVHDYDLSMDLQILKKLRKLKSIHIIGVSPKLSENEVFKKIEVLIHSIISNN